VGKRTLRALSRTIIVGLSALLWMGCVLPLQEKFYGDAPPPDGPTTSEEGQRPAGPRLIKPMIPPETLNEEPKGPSSLPQPNQPPPMPGGPPSRELAPQMPGYGPPHGPGTIPPQNPGVTPLPSAVAPPPPSVAPPPPGSLTPVPPPGLAQGAAMQPAGPSGTPTVRPPRPPQEKTPAGREWEDQKVRTAAREMGSSMASVGKLKLCYDHIEDEWWLILYQEVGPSVELKQFVWSRDQERFEPHLVLNRIPKSRMPEHLARQELNRACEVMEVSKKGQ
jgi:hypothetical protein